MKNVNFRIRAHAKAALNSIMTEGVRVKFFFSVKVTYCRIFIQFPRLNERTCGQMKGYSLQQSWVRDTAEFAAT